MDPATTTSDSDPARYAAAVEALLGVRTDYAGARYDAAVHAALAAHRIDLDTARELRWWQRASVRAAQEYAATLVPQVLAACERADAEAAADAAEVATSWQRAKAVLAAGAPAPRNETAEEVDRPAVRWNAPTRLIAVPDTRNTPRTLPRRASVEETQQAVRAALRSSSIDLDDAARKDERHHAHSASAS
jgi:hypothetical protein